MPSYPISTTGRPRCNQSAPRAAVLETHPRRALQGASPGLQLGAPVPSPGLLQLPMLLVLIVPISHLRCKGAPGLNHCIAPRDWFSKSLGAPEGIEGLMAHY